MAHSNPAQEWLRLQHTYQEMSDEELLKLSDAFDELTSAAQSVLPGILQSRGLALPVSPLAAEIAAEGEAPQHGGPNDHRVDRNSSEEEGSFDDRDGRLSDHGVAVRAYESFEDADLLSQYLAAYGVQSLVIRTKRGYPVRFPEILVFPEDVERADALLDRADLEALRNQAEANESGPVIKESSNCPSCGSAEILLQPQREDCLNDWRCDHCNHCWQDRLPQDWPTGKS